MAKLSAVIASLLLFAAPCFGQTSVSVLLVPIAQYFDNNGKPLASGCLFTFAAGTNNNQATYSDSAGVNALPNPILLNAGGYPTNATGSITTVYVTNQSYKFVLKTTGGANCSTGSQIYSADNIQGFLGIQNLANTWNLAQTFTLPITILATSLQEVIGAPTQQTTLNFPPPAANIQLNFPNTADTMTGRATTDTLSNKTIDTAAPNTVKFQGVQVVNGPATYISVGNSVTGTIVGRPTKLVAGLAQFIGNSDTSGAVGIAVQCVSSCGQPGSTIIQQSGTVSCFFDNATTAGDYVQLASGANCHDAGATQPLGVQTFGQVLVTSGISATPLSMFLFGPGIVAGSGGASAGCTNVTQNTIVNNNATQALLSCTLPANSLSAGSLLAVDLVGIESTASAMTITLSMNLGGGTGCNSTSATTGVANNQPIYYWVKFATITAGAGGTANMSCGLTSSVTSGGGIFGPAGAVGGPTISVNTTIANTLLVNVQMSVVNAANSVTGQLLKAVIF